MLCSTVLKVYREPDRLSWRRFQLSGPSFIICSHHDGISPFGPHDSQFAILQCTLTGLVLSTVPHRERRGLTRGFQGIACGALLSLTSTPY